MKETSTLTGAVSKNSPLIHFIGAVDELNSCLGLVKALLSDSEKQQFINSSESLRTIGSTALEDIQKTLMKMMSHASAPADEKYFLSENDVAVLESETVRLKAALPKSSGFVIPGRNVTEAHIHIARTAARRAEREFFDVEPALCINAGEYLNKLSNYLFVLAQTV